MARRSYTPKEAFNVVVGLLGVQGAFRDHIPMVEKRGLGWAVIKRAPFPREMKGLIIPGGESTVMMKYLRDTGLDLEIRDFAASGGAVWGICAGAAVLAAAWKGGGGGLGLLNMAVLRNGNGRHEASGFRRVEYAPAAGGGDSREVFIREPLLDVEMRGMDVLARSDGVPVWIAKGRVTAMTFHPELTGCARPYDYFQSLLKN